MQNVVGPTLVFLATKFGLGAEIQSPTGLLVVVPVCNLVCQSVCMCSGFYNMINVKKLAQFKTPCKDDMVNSDN